MGFNIMDLMNGATRAAVEGVDNYEAITLNLDEIKVTKHNRYSMDDLEELATSILMDGLQEPLIIGRVNGEYLLSGGHRRREALVILQNEGHTEITQNIPCRFKDMTETQFRLSLLIGNTFNRKMTDYDLMNQAADWKEVLTQARKEKLLVLEEGKRVRDYVAAVLGEKPTKIAQLEAINNNATEGTTIDGGAVGSSINGCYESLRGRKEREDKSMSAKVEKTGSCSFCGQTKIIQVPEEWEQGQINEAVTCECECEQAQAYAKAKERKDKAKKRVNELFGGGAEKPVAEDVVNLLIATVDAIEDKHMKGITVDVGHGVKAKVSKMAKESIKVERSENKKTTYEE